MSGTSAVASSAEKIGGDHKRAADADINELSANNSVVDRVYVKDAENGSPPSHPLHVVKDGGLTAWSTALGAYVGSAQ